ncbi:conserved hypothetical protein [Xenorhabdus nematophila F1]|uniref:Uncharacterized protein n=1 Tax=Xenorhabdus nematophila (strain ATCC 19061 / DSM 3370 / CCUG 14189 / LMG 1036 / NCIMB 9965 / AN6) TaxID=406817 RepID=D3VJI3_XENNA|nr:hypothetical protein XNC1_0668 [Xenorhabdus nematophila ATCC 19061]CCW30896.1 conserved hypothetical protein [Xenorhabdus nematophila F1]CEE91548.1 hypothetical protein XNA1_220007 [Xenorhabdus nematophila str. Anatoliense]CEF30036.1 hypothetical protein XNW1_220007 [Xenorhabdus nematophila str. Websteri]CEK21653.1 hypothetical protein XNC2_0657 [Xenorhabdus nematophila AN6/1]
MIAFYSKSGAVCYEYTTGSMLNSEDSLHEKYSIENLGING